VNYDIFENVDFGNIESIISKYGNLAPYGLNGEKLVDITPGFSRTENTLTTRYGLGQFPYHTDTAYWHIPAHYIVLYCKHPGSGGRRTNFIDTGMLRNDSKFESLANNAIYLVKRNFKSFYSRPLFNTRCGVCFRFDSDCMIPQNKAGYALVEKMLSVEDSSFVVGHNWKKGDLLVLNNHRFVHSRGSSNTDDFDRILTRGLIL